jgi:hypothetical protein
VTSFTLSLPLSQEHDINDNFEQELKDREKRSARPEDYYQRNPDNRRSSPSSPSGKPFSFGLF